MPEELGGLFALFLIGLLLYCLFDAITTPPENIRNLPKGLWIVLILILGEFGIGSILWLIAGRPTAAARAAGTPYKGNSGPAMPQRKQSGSARSVAPDDNPEFLNQLKKSNNDHEAMLNQWEADLRKREQEMRDKPDVPPDV